MSKLIRLSSQSLPSEPVPMVLSLPSNNWTKIGHLNVHSYLAKWEDIKDQAMRQAYIMCFTETFLEHHQNIQYCYLPMQDQCQIFRLDRLQTCNQDLTKGGIMIVCPSSLQPIRINIHHPNHLEVVSITATFIISGCTMCIVAVYRCPQQQLAEFLNLLDNYMANLPQIVPSIILGDFDEDLLSRSNSSRLLQSMSTRGFNQLVQLPTTDSGSLLDHINYNGTTNNTFIDAIDTTRIMIAPIYHSLSDLIISS